jgi:threonyl-tRNA synthetase
MAKTKPPRRKPDDLESMRHSLAHVLAMAVLEMFPEAKLGIGPAIEDGFYYDFELPRTLIPEDLPILEGKMRKIVKKGLKFEGKKVSPKEAVDALKKANQPYKVELAEEFAKAKEPITFYHTGEFVDLCRGGHVKSTKDIGAFKLTRIAGAYWRGDEKNPQLQRIYGVAFKTEENLKEHLKKQEAAKKHDHRVLGPKLGLFTHSDLVGGGLPLWGPRGTVLRDQINDFIQSLRAEQGFEKVTIPHITKKELYEQSGHWDKFKHELYRITSREGQEFAMKPMNCPHHAQIYKSEQRSYRDLPVRYQETTMVYRDEQSGEVSGLSRVRSITQDDAHVFCREDQIKEEALALWRMVQEFYGVLDFPLKLRLSRRDPAAPKDYAGTVAQWEEAESELEKVLKAQKDMAVEEDAIGEAAFYGPKLDFIAKDSLGREWQVATIQLDFAQPAGLGLAYIDEDGKDQRPVMIHCAFAGSLERFISILIEHFGGAFPLWLAPEQVRVLTIADRHQKHAQSVVDELKQAGLRAELDDRTESIGKKIRDAEVQKVPYTFVIGDKEQKAKAVAVRSHARGDLGSKKLAAVTKDLTQETESKALPSR